MDAVELGVCGGSFLFHQCVFRLLQAFGVSTSKNSKEKSSDDEKKLYSCYLSHIHCMVTIVSCLSYWASRPVDVLSAKYMVEVKHR
jgi:hypothetical protein